MYVTGCNFEEETEKKQKSRTEHGIGKLTVPKNLNTATWQQIGSHRLGHLKSGPMTG